MSNESVRTGNRQNAQRTANRRPSSKAPAKRRKKHMQNDEKFRRIFKNSSAFAWGLLINVIIVFLVVKVFSYSFNFAYGVFGNVCKDPLGSEYVVIEIPNDSSSLQIGKALEDNDIIDNKYIFFAKVKIKKLGNKIKPGKYGLSSSMTYDEIINMICGINEEKDDESGTAKEE